MVAVRIVVRVVGVVVIVVMMVVRVVAPIVILSRGSVASVGYVVEVGWGHSEEVGGIYRSGLSRERVDGWPRCGDDEGDGR